MPGPLLITQKKFLPRFERTLLTLATLALVCSASSSAQSTAKVLYHFSQQGENGGLIFDAKGNLYGTFSGFRSLYGSVFEVKPYANGLWSHKFLYSFTGGTDGAYPQSNLIFDKAGHLYGATAAGGTNPCAYGDVPTCGTIFELTPTLTGPWTERVLYSFAGGTDGVNPSSGVISDSAGNLYGTTASGGLYHGTVFRLSPGAGGVWNEKVLYRFTGDAAGDGPAGGLVLDNAGNLYGTTLGGGKTGNCGTTGGCGTIFELSPGSNDTWTFHLLYRFCSRANCSDGGVPSGVILDNQGNLYGTTRGGGITPCWAAAWGCGTAFKLLRGTNGSWTFHLLHSFCSLSGCPDGAAPSGSLIFDGAGNLYGATGIGGSDNQGTIFKLLHNPNSTWTLDSLYSFCALAGCANEGDGLNPGGTLTLDSAGNLYGTAVSVVFEILP